MLYMLMVATFVSVEMHAKSLLNMDRCCVLCDGLSVYAGWLVTCGQSMLHLPSLYQHALNQFN